ncbi:MAG: hypothetical protein ACR2PH_10320 [Desulfobulbia bacterium]
MLKLTAFLYDDYYCWTPRGTFKGVYDDEEDALNQLRGGRHENQNLELYNPNNGEWKSYTWTPYYEKDMNDNLTHDYMARGEVVERVSIPPARSGDYIQEKKYDIAYDAGYWKREHD